MATLADMLTDAESAEMDAMLTRREVHEKREALIDRDGHLNFKGERCSPCVDCGRIFTASGLRLTRGGSVRLLCRSCLAQAKTDQSAAPAATA